MSYQRRRMITILTILTTVNCFKSGLTVVEIAHQSGISRSTVYRRLKLGGINF